jgi:hypothetical protein
VSSLLSAISGKFSTNLILGTFFPVTVLVFLARVLWVPLLPAGFHPALLAPLAGLDDKWELLILTLVTIVLSGLLYNLNIPLIRFYEGYPWKDTWIGRHRTAHHRATLLALLARKGGAYPLSRALAAEAVAVARRAANPKDPRAVQLDGWASQAAKWEDDAIRGAFRDFPKEGSVLPTRLGNVIRSFENYPERQYGMAAIPLWPRLIAVIGPSYAETIDSAKVSLDFMLNSATLAGLLALLLFITGLVYPSPLASSGSLAGWLFEVAVLAGLAVWLYEQAIGRALDWGDQVRGAFDLYRGDLLTKLGYGQKPRTIDEERELWRGVSIRLIAGDPLPGAGALPAYQTEAAAPTSCRCAAGTKLDLARGVASLPQGGGLEVVIEVRHSDPRGAACTELVIEDTVPDGFDYQWNSVTASEGEARVEGTNPYRFRLSLPLAPGTSRELAYRILPRAPVRALPGDHDEH